MKYVIQGNAKSKTLLQRIRLGDKVEAFAKPIARAIDRVAGTKIAKCGGCDKRRRILNGD